MDFTTVPCIYSYAFRNECNATDGSYRHMSLNKHSLQESSLSDTVMEDSEKRNYNLKFFCTNSYSYSCTTDYHILYINFIYTVHVYTCVCYGTQR